MRGTRRVELALTQDKSEALAMLALFLESLIRETLSPDTLALAVMRTEARAVEMGIDPVVSREIIEKMVTYAKARQTEHPLASLF